MRSLTGPLLLSFLLFAPSFAQQRIGNAFIRSAPIDSPVVAGDTSYDQPREEKSTVLAMALSAVLPGAGQVYTERYLSIPLILGFGYYFGSQVFRMNDRYKDFKDQFEASIVADTLLGQGNVQLKDIRDFYRDERDQFIFYLGITYLLNIVDAYVGAALYGFDVSPTLDGGARIRLTVPVGRPPRPGGR